MKWRMLTTDILELKSIEGGRPGVRSVKDALEEKDISSPYHQAVCEEMRKAGVNLVPVCVLGDYLVNGHHRVKIAMSLGHEEMLVSDYEYECGEEEGWRKEVVYCDDQHPRVSSMAG